MSNLDMIYSSLQAAALLLGCRYQGHDAPFLGISTDSRTVVPGELFIALKGENFDGHDFLEQAANAGAAGAIVSKSSTHAPLPCLEVTDTLSAFALLAQDWRARFQIPVIAITGSTGKTTTKELLAKILAACFGEEAVLATHDNENNLIGVPKVLSRLHAKHRVAVIEMGMNRAGEISRLSRMTRPTIALITNISSAHIGNLGSIEQIARAKAEIWQHLHPKGLGIMNADERYARRWQAQIRPRHYHTFGINAHRTTVQVKPLTEGGFHVKTPKGEADITWSLTGKHQLYNAGAAIAAAIAIPEVTIDHIVSALSEATPTPSRMESVHYPNAGVTLVDDTYNASQASTLAAIDWLGTQAPAHTIFVLGDLAELGDTASTQLEMVANACRNTNIEQVMTFGDNSALVSESHPGGWHFHADELDALINALKGKLLPNTTVLIKGSRVMHMERIVEALKATLQTQATTTTS